ncbi:MAG: hypothetical protein IT548_09125 [Alphaproteobacteria bacterium]|nr:hypothetical protein [Alphaproteobacteria bacterium]
MPHRKTRIRGERQLEQLAARPSNWRIFNVGHHVRHLRDIAPAPSARMFNSRKLDDAIVVKHALRSNERDLFERPPLVATKIVVPLDPHQISLGAFSFFLGERTAPQMMQRLLGIAPAPGRTAPGRDEEILRILDRAPSLDTILLKDLLADERFGIPSELFAASLADQPDFGGYVQRELAPLVALATGSREPAKVARFVDSVFGASLGRQAEDFFSALGVAESGWGEIAFAWKAAFHYERQAADTDRRFQAMAGALRVLQTYGHNEAYPRSLLTAQHRELAAALANAFARCRRSFAQFNTQRRAAIIASGRMGELTAYLTALPATVRDYALGAALLDHIVSYWAYATRGFDPKRMPAEVFSAVAADLCAAAGQHTAALAA